MENWKSQLMSDYKITEIAEDNVFFVKTNSVDFQDEDLNVVSELGKHYEILSIKHLTVSNPKAIFRKGRMIVVVRKK